MKGSLYILPPFTDEERVSTTVNRSIMKHRKLSRLLDSCYIPQPTYELVTIEEIETNFESGTIYPENAVYRVTSETGNSIQAEDLQASYQRFESLLTYIKSEEKGKSVYQSEFMHSYSSQLKEKVQQMGSAPNLLPLLRMEHDQTISLDKRHVPMMEDEEWVVDLIQFLKQLTEANVAMNQSNVDFDSFLFDESGRLAAFIHYDAIDLYDELDSVLEHNIKALVKLLTAFYDYVGEHISHNSKFNLHDSRYSKLYQRLQSGRPFDSFDEILAIFHGEQISEASITRIGVFLDVANIYTDLNNLHIDYARLFAQVFGKENVKYIKDKYAFFFEPQYHNEAKNKLVKERQEALQFILKDQGFLIDTSSNEREKAKQIIGGLEHDEDDGRLIRRMEERISRLDSVLLLSGDKDYYDVLKTYKEQGIQVKVISTQPHSTSDRLVSDFDHHYITEYWDCIILGGI